MQIGMHLGRALQEHMSLITYTTLVYPYVARLIPRLTHLDMTPAPTLV